MRTAWATQAWLITGSMPGMAASTSETWLLGSPPNSVEAPENSFALEATWACTSRPITTSQPRIRLAVALFPSLCMPLRPHGALPLPRSLVRLRRAPGVPRSRAPDAAALDRACDFSQYPPAVRGAEARRIRERPNEAQNPSRGGRTCACLCRHSRRSQDLQIRLPRRPQRPRSLHAERELHARRARQRHGGPDQARQGPQDHSGPGGALGDRRPAQVALLPAQGREVPRRRGLHRRRRGVLDRAHAQPRVADPDASARRT